MSPHHGTRKMPTSQPSRKVSAATGGSAVGVAIAAGIVELADEIHQPDVDGSVPGMLVTAIYLVTAAAVTFVSGYLAKRRTDEVA